MTDPEGFGDGVAESGAEVVVDGARFIGEVAQAEERLVLNLKLVAKIGNAGPVLRSRR